MDFLLLLIGLVMTAIICSARGIVSGLKHPTARSFKPRPLLTAQSNSHGRPVKIRREPPCITIKECETLIHTAEGVLFITVTDSGRRPTPPFYSSYSLVMTPHQLVNELRWFPPTSHVVLWGETALCYSVFELLEGAPMTTPIYVLKGMSGRWDAA